MFALLRAALTVTVLVTVYYLVPLRGLDDLGALIGLVLGLVAFTISMAWQVRAIALSPFPQLRAFQAVAVGLPLILLIFAMTYVVLAQNQPASFTQPLARTDSLSFTVTVFTTVGFGDITPYTQLARLIVTGQMLVNLIVLGVLARLILGAVQLSVRRRSTGEAGGPES